MRGLRRRRQAAPDEVLDRARATAPAEPTVWPERRAPPRDRLAVLGHTRSSTFTAGANRTAAAAGAPWTLLLWSLELETVLCVGVPTVAGLSTLSRLADQVVIACGGDEECVRALKRSSGAGLANVQAFAPGDVPSLPPIDLAVIGSGRAAARLSATGWLSAAVSGARAVFVDLGSSGLGSGTSARVRRLTGTLGPMHVLRLTPSAGEVRTVAAAGDAATLAYLDRLAVADAPGRSADLRSLARRASRLGHSGSRRGTLVVQGGRPDRLTPPAYLAELARAGGVEIAEHRVGLVAPSDHASRKALLFLFAGADDGPEYVVKLTREGAHNARLENEWRALKRLTEARLNGSGLMPRAAFFGHHGGLAALGQTAIAGTPFRRRTTARSDCVHARRAVDWLLELGAATAHPAPDNRAAAQGLRDLLARFASLYELTAHQRSHVERQLDLIEAQPEPLPLVFQHGDPGTWNLLITDDGRPAFLDWEAAEPHGMPLWDLFYFVRSFGLSVARVASIGSSVTAFGRQFLGEQALNRLLVDSIERQCAEIGLARELVEPLLLTCLVHRALKEAVRLHPHQLDAGHYVNLVRLCVDRRDAPGLRRLYGVA